MLNHQYYSINNPYLRKRAFKAFSLVELLIICAMLAVLVSLLMPIFKNTIKISGKVSCVQQIRQIVLAIDVYSSDYEGYLPPSLGQIDYAQDSLNAVGLNNRPQSGLGCLLYGGYIDNGELLNCPVELDGMESLRSKSYNSHQKTIEGYRAAVYNDNSWQSSFCYRGQTWHEDDNRQPAHGPVIDKLSPYINHISKRPCTYSSCGDYHHTLAIVSDDFSSRFNKYDPQGKYHHEDLYNVGYTDGHVESILDPAHQVINLIPNYYWTSDNMRNKLISEDVWDAFDGDIGMNYGRHAGSGQPYNYLYGLKN